MGNNRDFDPLNRPVQEGQRFETLAVRKQAERSPHHEHSVPIFMTSSYMFEDTENARSLFAEEMPGNIYSRYSNPNTTELVEKLCLLEGAEAGFATASGMAAMFTSIISFLNAGDHLVACRSVFGSTHAIITKLLPRWNISHSYVDIDKPETWEEAFQSNTKMFFCETPSNPALDIIDIEFLSSLCKKKNVLLNIDNCFATPYLQNPIKFGADIVTHSGTKFIDGQGRSLGGAILGRSELIDEVRAVARISGPALSPFNAWILSKSLETLSARMDRHCQNALSLARQLDGHPKIQSIKYPGLPSHPQYTLAKKQMRYGGGLITFELKGGIEAGRTFLDSLRMCSISANLGDTRTIATHPASTTHAKLAEAERQKVGIGPGMVRISVGLEHIDDIVADINQALE